MTDEQKTIAFVVYPGLTPLDLVGPLQVRLIHAMLDRHLIGGRRWRLALPPPVPGRYSLLHQFDKRVLQPRRQRVPG